MKRQTSRCHVPERGIRISHRRENPILCIGSFRYESLPLILRQEEKIHFKEDRDSMDMAQNRRIECRASVFGAVKLWINLSYFVINCSVTYCESSSHITVNKAYSAKSVDLT